MCILRYKTRLALLPLSLLLFFFAFASGQAGAGTTLNFDIDWDPVAYETQALLEVALKNKLEQCPAIGRPSYSRLLGSEAGGSYATPRLFVRVRDSASYETSCHSTITADFPGLKATPNPTGSEFCFHVDPAGNPTQTGFVSGITHCPSIFGAQCSLSSQPQTVCTVNTECAGGTCSIVPQLFYYDFTISLGIDVEQGLRSKTFLGKVQAHLATVSDPKTGQCKKDVDFRGIAFVAAHDPSTKELLPDIIRVLLTNNEPISQQCEAALKSYNDPTSPSGDPDFVTFDNSGQITLSASLSSCFHSSSFGLVDGFQNIGTTCPYPRPLGWECGEIDEICPAPASTCDQLALSPPDKVCTLRNPTPFLASTNIHYLRYESATLGANAEVFVTHFLDHARQTACKDVVLTSGAMVAVDQSAVQFDYYFLAPPKQLPQACIDLLESITAKDSQSIKLVTYFAYDSSMQGIPPLSCFETDIEESKTTSRTYSLVKVTPGGQCPWKRALTTGCRGDLDCDTASGVLCLPATAALRRSQSRLVGPAASFASSSSNVCTNPGNTISDGEELVQFHLTANGFLGTTQGEALIRVFFNRLNENCKLSGSTPISIEGYLAAIATGGYNKATIYALPNDTPAFLKGCSQNSIQMSASQANLIDLEKGKEAKVRRVGENHEVVFGNRKDFDVLQGGDPRGGASQDKYRRGRLSDEPRPENRGDTMAGNTPGNGKKENNEKNEGGEGGSAPPVVVPLKILSMTMKRQTEVVPKSCVKTSTTILDSKDISCRFLDLACDLPCPFAHPCELDSHCGPFGKCSAKKCIQAGEAAPPPKPGGSPTISLGIGIIFVALAFAFW